MTDQQLLEWALSELREAQDKSTSGSVTVHLHAGRICKIDHHESRRPPENTAGETQ